MEWVVDASIFQDMRTHGNTNWIAKELVMLAVLWVWSEKSQLTAAFGEAIVWSQRLIGRAAVGSYQALTNALVTYGGQLVPLLWNRLAAADGGSRKRALADRRLVAVGGRWLSRQHAADEDQ